MALLEEPSEDVLAQNTGQTHRSAPTQNMGGVNLGVHPVSAVDYS